jgi:hypothetical protein
MHRITKIAVTGGVAAALITTMATASASVAIDATGKGFVGKGEVQSAFAMNNATMQKAVDAKAFSFSAEQPTTRSLSQNVSQVGTQAGTTAVTQTATQSAKRPSCRI